MENRSSVHHVGQSRPWLRRSVERPEPGNHLTSCPPAETSCPPAIGSAGSQLREAAAASGWLLLLRLSVHVGVPLHSSSSSSYPSSPYSPSSPSSAFYLSGINKPAGGVSKCVLYTPPGHVTTPQPAPSPHNTAATPGPASGLAKPRAEASAGSPGRRPPQVGQRRLFFNTGGVSMGLSRLCLPGVSERPSEDGDACAEHTTPDKAWESCGASARLAELWGPRGAAQRSSASVRRALFARRRLDASSSPGVGAASLAEAPAPPRSPSPVPLRRSSPPSSLSVSTPTPLPPGLSPVVRARVPEPGADASSRGLQGDGAAAARLVSLFILRHRPLFLFSSFLAACIISGGQKPPPPLTCDWTSK